MAALPNVACKISGIIGFGTPIGWTVDDFRPYVDYVVEAFGWDRVVWGSNWPVCTVVASLAQWIEVTFSLVRGATEGEKSKLFSDNAKRIYRLSTASPTSDPARSGAIRRPPD